MRDHKQLILDALELALRPDVDQTRQRCMENTDFLFSRGEHLVLALLDVPKYWRTTPFRQLQLAFAILVVTSCCSVRRSCMRL